MRGMIYIDSFSGKVSYLSVKQKRDPMFVLRAIKEDPNVSCWDMCEHSLWRTIDSLVSQGLLNREDDKSEYPWNRYTVTPDGEQALAEFGLLVERQGKKTR